MEILILVTLVAFRTQPYYNFLPGLGIIDQRTFHVDAANSKPDAQPFYTSNEESKSRCASLCLRDTTCSVFAYNGVQCSLYDTYDPGILTVEPNSEIWI